MAAPPNFEEGQLTYRPPRFNGQYYGWWKTRMYDFMMAEDSELWDIICDGPHVPMKKLKETIPMVPKGRKEYNDIDRKAAEKNNRAKKILMCGIGLDEYNRVSACDTAKEIWEALQTAHEGTTQVKQSKIGMLTTEYELFRMKDNESIQDMHTRFTSIINELHSLGDVIPRNKLVRKILNVLPGSWESKVNAIIEAKDLQTLTMDELISNLKTYEMKRKKDSERREPKKETNLVFKAKSSVSSDEDSDIAYPTKRFLKMGDSSSESEREPDVENSSMMAVETETAKFDSLFALMAQSDDDKEDEDDEEILTIELGEAEQSRDDLVVCVVDLNETIANLEKEKEALNERITSVENERDDLMVVVVDLKETIEGLNNDKHTLEGKIATTEEERDDLFVICNDLEETIEGLNREHRNVSLGKVKEVVSETHILLEKELTVVKTSLCSELKKNQQLQAELEKIRIDLKKSLKWTRSSDAVIAMYLNNSGNRQGIGFQREKTPYKPHNKYVTVPDNWLWNSKRKRIVMDYGCSKHMTKNIMNFFSLKALQEGNVSLKRKEKEKTKLEDVAWTMLIDYGITKKFWAKAVNTAFCLDQLGKFNVKDKRRNPSGVLSTKQGHKVYNKGHTKWKEVLIRYSTRHLPLAKEEIVMIK
ncbi:uncharacterized protein [Nicotiana sylvestris]|uniref:uncharacterized protein n=1 Tax=Nicotiana sylvestris TaxID=4096 RepID=UPI00388C55C6